MKITVCIKQVPATNEVRMDPVTNTIIREGIESILNPFDTYAVEEALRLRERIGVCELSAISMGIPNVAEILREIMALGIDRAHLLSDRAFAGADTLATANALALGIQKSGGADLIICGKMATDGDTAQVGPMLAEVLGYEHITDISTIEEISKEHIVCRKLTDDGYLRVEARLPLLITVVKEINVPRLPSMSGIMDTIDAEVPVWTAADVGADPKIIGLAGSPTQVVKTFVPDLQLESRWLEGNMSEKTAALLSCLHQDKLLDHA